MKRAIKYLLRYICTNFAMVQLNSYGDDLSVNFPSHFTKNTYLGNNCNFNGMKIYGSGNVTIGNNFHSGKGCLIMTSVHNYDSGKKIPYDDSNINKDVTIGDNVWLGHRVMIMPGVKIEEGVIIQAGSVVVNDISYCGIAGGHPAKVFKYRDITHYEELKRKKLYH